MVGIMGRRRKVAVEGAVLDLTGDEPVLIVPKAAPIEEKRTVQELIASTIASMKKTCEQCGCEMYSNLRIWGGKKICPECYAQVYPAHRDELNRWMEAVGLKGCAFCGKPRTNPSGFHFDHINMFEKSGAVGRMLFDGVALDRIKEEIQKCQLLCLCCHAIVTKMEVRLGFTHLKVKRWRPRTDVSKGDYSEKMGEVYEYIKALRGRGGGPYGDLSGSS